MVSWKAPDSDNIHTGGFVPSMQFLFTTPFLQVILVKCLRERKAPQDIRDAKIINLYKNRDV